MLHELHYTLLTDGSSDEALRPIIDWVVRDIDPSLTIVSAFADLRGLPRPPKELPERIVTTLQLFPCDILFIHRDAENQNPHVRQAEIQAAIDRVPNAVRHVPIVPIKMTEAWLLTDESAIRHAAGNPNGVVPLALPDIARIESLSDPKQVLSELVSLAAEINTRRHYRSRRLRSADTTLRVAEATISFRDLSRLTAFAQLRTDISLALTEVSVG